MSLGLPYYNNERSKYEKHFSDSFAAKLAGVVAHEIPVDKAVLDGFGPMNSYEQQELLSRGLFTDDLLADYALAMFNQCQTPGKKISECFSTYDEVMMGLIVPLLIERLKATCQQ